AAMAAGVAAVSVLWLRAQGPLSGATLSAQRTAQTTARATADVIAPGQGVSYVVPRAPAARAVLVPSTTLANYVVAHSMVSSPVARRNLLSAFMTSESANAASVYDIREVGRTRLNRRDTHIITVSPKDEYRYGYRLWIDDSTAMPLKTQLCDTHGHVIEQIVFASLTLPSRIPDSAFKTEVSTEGFQWLRNETPPPAQAEGAMAWSAMRL